MSEFHALIGHYGRHSDGVLYCLEPDGMDLRKSTEPGLKRSLLLIEMDGTED
jgi:hypothetical protein